MILSTLFGHRTGGALRPPHRLRKTKWLGLQGRLIAEVDAAIQYASHDLFFPEGSRKPREHARDVGARRGAS